MSDASRGLHFNNQRRGVIPLVLLRNFPGYSASNSGKSVRFSSAVWSSATPLTAWEPTTARLAMRTDLPPFSSISEQMRFLALSPGQRSSTTCMSRSLIS